VDAEKWEVREDLLHLTRDRGHPVTAPKLARWHRAGLIPRPEQRSLGRGHGTQTVYPPGTGEQLIRLCEIHFDEGVKRLPHVGWQLWWEGYAVSFDLVRAFLRHIATTVDEQLKDLLDPETNTISDEKWKELVEGSRTARLDKPVRGMRGRVGRDRMPTLMSIMLEVNTGLYETFQVGAVEGLEEDDSDAQLVIQAFGLDRGSRDRQTSEGSSIGEGLEVTLEKASKVLREHTLSEAADVATDQELLRSRDHMRLILQGVQQLGSLAEEMPHTEAVAFRDVNKEMRDTRPPEQTLLVLGWTMWGLWGPPGMREVQDSHHELLKQALDVIRGLGWLMINAKE
jgi:hypothetical protein